MIKVLSCQSSGLLSYHTDRWYLGAQGHQQRKELRSWLGGVQCCLFVRHSRKPRCELRSISPLLTALSLVLKHVHDCLAIKTVCTHRWLYFVQDAAQPARTCHWCLYWSLRCLTDGGATKLPATTCAMHLSVLRQSKLGGRFTRIWYWVKGTREEGAVKQLEWSPS